MIFETQRLKFRKLTQDDFDHVYELVSDPAIVAPVPRPPASREESSKLLSELLNEYRIAGDKRIWGVLLKESSAFIGMAGFLRNDEHQEEIAYRLKTAFWGVGYGTEIAEGLLQFGFEECKMELITADVNTENHRSAKILSKFFTPVREFYNNNDQCFDRRYALKREDWKRRFEPNEE